MKNYSLRGLTAVAVVAVAGGLTIGVGAVWRTQRATAETQGQVAAETRQTPKKQIPVVLTPVNRMAFENRIEVSGSVHAKRYALVSARIPGTLDALYVDEGDRVEAGKTKLFQTDSLKLIKAVAIAQHNLTVSECSVKEKQALLEKDVAGKQQADKDAIRYRELIQRNAIAAQLLDQQEAHCKECEADVKHTQALIDLANAQLEQARLNLTIAQKDLDDSLVSAPISGWVSQRLREPGEMASAGTPVLRIEDLSLLEISVFLPEEFYAQVVQGKTVMRVRVGETDLGDRPVNYKSPTVHPKLRTFEVKGLVESPPDGVVPGCLARVAIVTDSRDGVGVPSGAVQIRDGKTVVFTVAEDKAKLIPVKTGRDLEGWREVLEGLSSGAEVISMGQFLVEEGAPVSVVQEDA